MKINFKHLLFIICTTILSCALAEDLGAQNVEMTLYEQKRNQLCTDAMEKIMNTMSEYDRTLFALGLMIQLEDAHEEGDIFQELAISENVLYKLCGIADGLQTEANLMVKGFDINKVYVGNALKEWSAIGQWYKQERLILDKTRTAEDVRREKERVEAARVLIGISGVRQRVKKDFLKWAKKDEFEKTEAYNERLTLKGIDVFDSRCFVHFNEMVHTEVSREMVGEYDADREGFNVKFYYEDDKETSCIGFWPLTPSQARHLSKPDWSKVYSKGLFMKEGHYFPATYRLGTGGDIKLGDPEPVELKIDDVVGIQPIVDGTHIFDYSEYSLNLIPHEEVRDSINIVLHKVMDGYRDVMEYDHEEYLPYITRFYKCAQVNDIMAPLHQMNNGREIILDLKNAFKSEYGCSWVLSGLDRITVDNAKMVGRWGKDNLGRFVLSCAEEGTILTQKEYRGDPLQVECLDGIIKLSKKYNVDINAFVYSIIRKSSTLSKKYKKNTQEEAVRKFIEELN